MDFFDINSRTLESQKQFRDEVERQEKIEREKDSIKLQSDVTKRLQDLQATFQKQREIDRQERGKEKEIEQIRRQEERRSDRKLLWKIGIWCAVIGSVMGAVVAKLFDVFFK